MFTIMIMNMIMSIIVIVINVTVTIIVSKIYPGTCKKYGKATYHCKICSAIIIIIIIIIIINIIINQYCVNITRKSPTIVKLVQLLSLRGIV